MLALPAGATTSGQGLAVGPDTSVWVVGADVSGGSYSNFRLERYSNHGAFLSSAPFTAANSKDQFGIAFDASGDVWLSGPAAGPSGTALGVWQFDPTGQTLLGSAGFASASYQVRPGLLAIDAAGNAWVPAAEQTSGSPNFQYDLFEYGPGAVFVSSSVYRRGGGVDGGFAASVDPSGSIWVAGVSSNPAGGIDAALWKHGGSGNLLAGFPVFWPNAFSALQNLDIALALNQVAGQIWIGTSKSYAACVNPDFALLQYAVNGTLASSSLWHDSSDAGDLANALAIDSSGNVWVVGQAAGSMALWEYNSGGTLASGYPQTGSFQNNAVAILGGSNVVVLSGDQPKLFVSSGQLAGSSGASSCSQPPSTGYVSGTLAYAAGFAAGDTVNVAVSTVAFLGQRPALYPFTASAGTTLNYSVPLQAGTTYSIAAFDGASGQNGLPPGTPFGTWQDYAPVSAAAGSTTSGVNFALTVDNVAPTSAISSIVTGSTLTALSTIVGTAADDQYVSELFLAALDQNTGLWWDVGTRQWISTTTTPYFQKLSPAESGKPDAFSWSQLVSTQSSNGSSNFGGFSGNLAAGHTYELFTRAQDLVQNAQSAPGVAQFTWEGGGGAPPSAPSSVNGYALGVSSIGWTWGGVTGATGYDVYAATGGLLGTTASTSFAELGLATNTAYGVCVTAANNFGQSQPACSQAVDTLAAVPGQPVFTLVSSTTVAVAWDPAGNPAGTSYSVRYSSTNFATDFFDQQTTQTSSGLTSVFASGEPIEVVVQAYNGQGIASGFSAAASTVALLSPPQPPQGIAGTALGVSSISWTWSASDGAAGYNVYTSSSGDLLGSTAGTSFAEAGLSTSSLYAVCIAGFNAAGEGPRNCGPSVYTLAATPGAPSLLQASSTTLQISWDPEGNQGAVYQVLASNDGFATNVSTPVPFSAGLQSNRFVLRGLASGTTYSIKVQAENPASQVTGFSPVSAFRTLYAPPDAPTSLSAAADQAAKVIRLAWQAASTGVPAVSFRLYRSTDGTSYSLLASTAAQAYADAPTASGTYYYEVSGVNADGLEGARSIAAFAGIDLFPPRTVSDLRLYGGNPAAGTLQLAWTAPSDDFSGTALYYLYTSSALPVTQGSSVTIPALAAGMTVTYTVSVTTTQALYFAESSQDGAGNVSPLSNVVLFDPVPPTLTSVSLSSGLILSRPLSVNVQAADNVAVASMSFSVDGVLASSTTGASASFFWDTRLLADGAHVATVAAFDSVGNAAALALPETINYAPPNAPAVTQPGQNWSTKVATIDVTGTADLGVSVQVMANALDLDTAASVGGSWAILPETLPQPGNVALQAVAYESRGFSRPSPSVSGVYSPRAPDPPELPTADAEAGGAALVSWSAPTTTGTIPAFYRVYRSTDDALLGAGDPAPRASLRVGDAITSLSFTETPPVDDLYFYAVTAVDGAGNESRQSDVVYVVTDRVPPSAQVLIATAPPLGVFTYNPSFVISEPLQQAPVFTFTPPGGRPIALDLAAVTAMLWQGTVTITAAMSSGTAAFAFQGVDLVGNVGTALSSATIAIRTIGPVGTLALSKTSPLSAGQLTFNLTLDEPAVATPTLAFTPHGRSSLGVSLAKAAPFDGTVWAGSVIVTSNTGDGEADLSYSAADALTNVNTLLVGATYFVIDTVPPNPPPQGTIFANSLPAGRIEVSWSAPFGERPAYYHIYRDGVRISTNIAPAADGTGFYIDTAAPGQHQYQISSLDLAGNESIATDPVALSKATPPAAPIDVSSAIASGQIQIAWQAGSTDTATFNLYRTTYSIQAAAGLPALRHAVSPFVDLPSVDAVYHYAVTALDVAGNESALSSEAVVTWAQGAPSVSIYGVADGSYANRNVAPVYVISDLTLDTNTVSATLDGQSFVSGSTVSAEGRHTLTVGAANVAAHYSTATVAFTIDKTPPTIAFSVASGAALISTSAVSVGIVVSDLNPGTSSFVLTNQLTGASAPYASGAPISRNGQYALAASATDLAGNTSTATVSFSVEVGPPAPAGLTVTVGATAVLSWTSPEPDVVAYRVLRDGVRISAALLSGTLFQDTGFTPGAHVYQVLAVDANGVVGPPAQATVPAASLSLPSLTLTRGFFDLLQPAVRNGSGASLNVGPAVVTLIDASGAAVASATSAVVSANAGQSVSLQDVIATPASLSATSLAHVAVALPTDPGAAVYLAGDVTLSAQDPAQPIVEVFPGTLVAGTLSPVQARLYNRGSAPMDVITAAVANSTFVPVNNVQVQLQTAQGTVLSAGGLLQADNGAAATTLGGRQVFFVTIPAGQSALLDPVRVLVPNTAAGTVNVAAFVSTPAYNVPGLNVAGTRSFASSTAQGTISQVSYVATSFTDRSVYDQGSSVTIHGQTLDAVSGQPVPNAGVTVQIISNGFTRTASAVSDASGNYAAGFFPLPNEAGLYTTYAAAPFVVTAGVQSTFTIEGLALQYASYNATLAQNSSLSFTVSLANTGATPIAGISANVTMLSGSSVTLTLDPASAPQTLAAGAQAGLRFTAAALPLSSTSTFSLAITESHGFSRQMLVTATVVPAQVIPIVTPITFAIGMIGGDSRSIPLVIQNEGFDTWRSVTISNPALSWVTIQGQSSLGDIPPGGNVNVTLQINPPSSLANGTYSPSPLLQITSLNAPVVAVQGAVAITSSRKGDVLVSVINADKPANGQGQGVGIPGAQVTLNSLDVAGLNFTMAADLNGTAAFSQIPSGNYAWNVSAKGFNTMSGTAVIEPGMTNQIQAVLPTATVSYQWSVTPTSIQDVYNITLNLVFQTNVPAPAIVVSPPNQNLAMTDGQTAYSEITVTNKGSVAAFNVVLTPTLDPHLSVTLPLSTIPELDPGQTVVIPVKLYFDPPNNQQVCGNVSVGIQYGYQCIFGLKVPALGPSVTYTAGSCPISTSGSPSTGGNASGGSGGGWGFAASGAGTSLVGLAPVTVPQCSDPSNSPKNQPTNKRSNKPFPGKRSVKNGVVVTDGHHTRQTRGIKEECGSPAPSFWLLYNSDNPDLSSLTPGWNANLNVFVAINPDGSYTFTDDEGNVYVFVPTGPLNQPINGGNCAFAQPVAYAVTMVPSFASSDPNAVPVKIVQRDRDGNTMSFAQYGGKYLPVLFADRNGNTLTYARDASGNLLKLTDVHGRYLSFSYNGQGQLASVSDQANRSIGMTYDAAGNLASDTDVDGDLMSYAYDSSHRMTQIAYANNGHTYFTYNPAGQVATQADDGGNNALSFVYLTSRTIVTDALHHQAIYDWIENSGLRKISHIQDALMNSTTWAYDANMNAISQMDALGRLTTFKYDGNSNMTSMTDALGQVTQTQYLQVSPGGTSGGFSGGGAGGGAVSGGSCGAGIDTGISIPNSLNIPLTISAAVNLPQTYTDAKGNKSSLTYDGRGNVIQAQDAASDQTQLQYDGFGHVTGVKDPLGNASAMAYDNNGAIEQVVDPLNRTTGIANDPLSRPSVITDPAGNKTYLAYDNAGNTTQLKDALNNITNIAYQPGRGGRLPSSITDANNHATSFGYDALGRVTSVTNALSQTASVTYDLKSRVSSVRTRNGQTIGMSYDNIDRLTGIATPRETFALAYDPVGNLTSISKSNGSALAFSYDALNRPTRLTETLDNGFSDSPSFGYDADGNRTSMSSPLGAAGYGYDALNRLTSLSAGPGSFAFGYDAASRLTSITYPNGIKATLAYDAAGQVTQIVYQNPASQRAVAFVNYGYDVNGNRTSLTDMAGAHAFGYDKLNRLTSASHPAGSNLPVLSESFALDAIGNRLSDALRTNYQFDAANRIVSDSSMTYTSDANGNRTSQTSRATGITISFKYDSADRLFEVDGPNSTVIATYKFDPTGRRIEKNVGGVITRFAYDGPNIRAILDASNNVIAKLIYVPGLPAPLAMQVLITENGFVAGTYFFHTDALGSVIALTDQNGNLVETYEYLAFGRAVVIDAQGNLHGQSTVGNPFMYAGTFLDAETGLYHMTLRDLDPDVGAFLEGVPVLRTTADLI